MKASALNMTVEHKQKISKAKVGHEVSEETRKKVGRKGRISNRKGVVLSDEIKENICRAALNRKKKQ